jgi:hypothetical protein
MSVICILPPRQSFWRSTGRLIGDVGRFCEELSFEETTAFLNESFWTQPHMAIAMLILKGLEYFVTRLGAVDHEK